MAASGGDCEGLLTTVTLASSGDCPAVVTGAGAGVVAPVAAGGGARAGIGAGRVSAEGFAA